MIAKSKCSAARLKSFFKMREDELKVPPKIPSMTEKMKIYGSDAQTPLREIVAPGWEIVEWREHRFDMDEVWCRMRAKHPRLGLDIHARYRFDENTRENQYRRAECIEKLWKQIVAEQAVEDGIV